MKILISMFCIALLSFSLLESPSASGNRAEVDSQGLWKELPEDVCAKFKEISVRVNALDQREKSLLTINVLGLSAVASGIAMTQMTENSAKNTALRLQQYNQAANSAIEGQLAEMRVLKAAEVKSLGHLSNAPGSPKILQLAKQVQAHTMEMSAVNMDARVAIVTSESWATLGRFISKGAGAATLLADLLWANTANAATSADLNTYYWANPAEMLRFSETQACAVFKENPTLRRKFADLSEALEPKLAKAEKQVLQTEQALRAREKFFKQIGNTIGTMTGQNPFVSEESTAVFMKRSPKEQQELFMKAIQEKVSSGIAF